MRKRTQGFLTFLLGVFIGGSAVAAVYELAVYREKREFQATMSRTLDELKAELDKINADPE